MATHSHQLSMFTIAPDASMEEAAQKIEDNDYGTLIVVDTSTGRVIGTVTDGDLRKAFLNHRLSVTPVRDLMNTHFLSVESGKEEKALELFKDKFYLRLIPIVDADGVLQAVVRRNGK